MVNAIAKDIELTAIECYDGKTHFKKCSIEYVNSHRKGQLADIDWQIISWWNIKKIRSANSIEYFECMVYPSLPKSEKWIYDSIKLSIPEEKFSKISIEAILMRIDEKRKEETYFKEQKKNDAKRERINKYLSTISDREYKELEEQAREMVESDFMFDLQVKVKIRELIWRRI